MAIRQLPVRMTADGQSFPMRAQVRRHWDLGSSVQRLLARGATGPCVMLGFGPGLTAESVLLLQQ